MTEAERLERERELQKTIAMLELDLQFEATDRRLGHAAWFIGGIIVGILVTAFILVPLV